ncbi:MAG: WD40/YVTN/BNR-like repeat-containing protein, partial [Hyphomicrobiaceae bacterium]
MDGASNELSRRDFFRGGFLKPLDKPGGWHRVEELAAGSGDVFWDGWADDAGVFIVGDDGAIFHYDGAAWTREKSPAPVPIHALWGLSRGNLWAVGWMGLILHYDGETWRKVQGCETDKAGKYSADPVNEPLFAIGGLSDGRAWAVGDRGTILHFDGEHWQAETSGVRSHLRCVIALPDGRVLSAGGDGTVLIRSQAGQWEKQTCP